MKTGIQVKRGDFFFDGKKVQLAGNHTWNTVQPFNGKTTELDELTGNFTRLWTVETRGMVLEGTFYGSNSSGLSRVGLVPWKSDGSLNKRYYRALSNVVAEAEEKDIVTGVVLFDNAFNAYFKGGWENHPLNGLGPRFASEVHTQGTWNRFQRQHVKRVAKVLAPYGNVIAEVGNELNRDSVSWFQKKVVSWWNKFSDAPIGVSYASGMKASKGRTQDWIAGTGADWAAPHNGERVSGFRGAYVFDTDHASALSSNVSGLRSAWNRGDSLWLMDGLGGDILRNRNNLQPDRRFILDSLAS